MAKKASQSLTYRVSAIVGFVLLGIAGLGLAWMFFGQQVGVGPSVHWLLPEATEAGSGVDPQLPVLLAYGITLAHPTENAALDQQEALLLASQREPDALNAKKVVARYELVNATSQQIKLKNRAAWIVWYQNIASLTGSGHDLYVVLDANSGTELFALRT
jgi:hypothetical protein